MNKYLISVSGVAMALVLSSTALGAVTVFSSGTPISSSDMNTNFANLNGNLRDGTCIGTMTRVGPTCIDQAEVGNSMTWAQAINTCRLAGKRLPTPGEFYAAFSSGAITLANGNSEWVDAVVAAGTDNTGNGGDGSFGVGRMGPNIGAGGGTSGIGILGFIAIDTATDAVGATVGFRCAR